MSGQLRPTPRCCAQGLLLLVRLQAKNRASEAAHALFLESSLDASN